jgi:hypothetical protein
VPQDRTFIERNRASAECICALAARQTDEQLLHPVGEHWTVAVALAHLAFWDRRAMDVLDGTEQESKLSAPDIDIVANDLFLPFWKALSPHKAAEIALQAAEALDKRLETLPAALLEGIRPVRGHWVERSLHRNKPPDEIEAVLK